METYRNARGYSKLRKSRLERCATIPILLVMSEFDPKRSLPCVSFAASDRESLMPTWLGIACGYHLHALPSRRLRAQYRG